MTILCFLVASSLAARSFLPWVFGPAHSGLVPISGNWYVAACHQALPNPFALSTWGAPLGFHAKLLFHCFEEVEGYIEIALVSDTFNESVA